MEKIYFTLDRNKDGEIEMQKFDSAEKAIDYVEWFWNGLTEKEHKTNDVFAAKAEVPEENIADDSWKSYVLANGYQAIFEELKDFDIMYEQNSLMVKSIGCEDIPFESIINESIKENGFKWDKEQITEAYKDYRDCSDEQKNLVLLLVENSDNKPINPIKLLKAFRNGWYESYEDAEELGMNLYRRNHDDEPEDFDFWDYGVSFISNQEYKDLGYMLLDPKDDSDEIWLVDESDAY